MILGGWLQTAVLGAASVVAGMINSMAGGGSLVSFPATLAYGLDPIMANATNAAAMAPGSLAAGFAYRSKLGDADTRSLLLDLLLPSLLGGLAGSAILLATPQKVFDGLVPLLVLLATGLLAWQALLRHQPKPKRTRRHRAVTMGLHFLVSLYGGYFGAGMGIMMLALFAWSGADDVHRGNAVKNVLAVVINATATVHFVARGAVDVPVGAGMAVCAVLGGIVGGRLAQRIDPRRVRWAVVVMGLAQTVYLGAKALRG